MVDPAVFREHLFFQGRKHILRRMLQQLRFRLAARLSYDFHVPEHNMGSLAVQ